MPEDGRLIAPVVVKKYANRRLYDTESSIYITLDTLADMVRHGRDFVVYDAKTGDDITRAVLTQIIMEEEVRGRNMLPTAFLRQLIGFYGDSRQGQVPDYLEHMMEQFIARRHQVPTSVPGVLPGFLKGGPMVDREEATAHDIAVMDKAISLFSPAYRPCQPLDDLAADAAERSQALSANDVPNPATDEMACLRREIARLRAALGRTANATKAAEMPQPADSTVRH